MGRQIVMTKEMIEAAAKAYREGYSAANIGRALGVSSTAVSSAIKKHGMKMRPPNFPRKKYGIPLSLASFKRVRVIEAREIKTMCRIGGVIATPAYCRGVKDRINSQACSGCRENRS